MIAPITTVLGAQGGFEAIGWGLFSTLGGFGAIVFSVLMLVVHLAFALGVYRDAQRRENGPDLVGPVIWALAAFLGGVFTAAIYWAVHYSTFRRREP